AYLSGDGPQVPPQCRAARVRCRRHRPPWPGSYNNCYREQQMMESVSSPPTVRERSKVALLEVAEQLIAEHGVDGVSLRQIGAAAGHRNPNAVQYHFGSRDGLLQAIVEHRLPPINRRRLELLDRADAAPADQRLRLVVEAVVRPLAEMGVEDNRYVE